MFTPAAVVRLAVLAAAHHFCEGEVLATLRAARVFAPAPAPLDVAAVERAVPLVLNGRPSMRVA